MSLFFFKQKTAYEMRISDWSSDVCSSDLLPLAAPAAASEGPLAGLFHPAVADWFTASFGMPTPVQQQAWQVTARHRNALITAPTGSGKTLAAFLAAINDLVSEGIEQGRSEEHTSELQSLMRISYAVFCLKKKNNNEISK